MTSSEMPTRLAMPQPFASGTNAERATIASISGDSVNYVDGFPGKYSLPASEGGKYVSRGEMNAIGNMASNDLHYFKCGGLNTFDAAFCAAIGGYPKGAVLKYLYNGWLYDVISLKDGNTYNVAENGPDDINWAYLSVPDKQTEEVVFFEGATGVSMGYNMLGIVQAKKTGPLLVKSSISPVLGSDEENYNYQDQYAFITTIGASLTILPLTSASQKVALPSAAFSSDNESISLSWNGWLSLAGDFMISYSVKSGNNQLLAMMDGIAPYVEKDKYYCLGFFCGTGMPAETTKSASQGYVYGIKLYTSCTGTIKLTYA